MPTHKVRDSIIQSILTAQFMQATKPPEHKEEQKAPKRYPVNIYEESLQTYGTLIDYNQSGVIQRFSFSSDIPFSLMEITQNRKLIYSGDFNYYATLGYAYAVSEKYVVNITDIVFNSLLVTIDNGIILNNYILQGYLEY